MKKKLSPTWILIANRACAHIFEGRRGLEPSLIHVKTLEHPEGKLKDGEFNTDRGGRAFQRYGHGRSALESSQGPADHEAERFALSITSLLAEEASRDAYGELVIVAEPRFLGKLREAMDRPAQARVTLTVPKDIAGLSLNDLRDELDRMLAEDERFAVG